MIFAFDDYRAFLAENIDATDAVPGALKRMADAIDVSSSFLSQVLKGSKNLSPEQAFILAEYLGLEEEERKYFEVLVNLPRATRGSYKASLRKTLDELRAKALAKSGTAKHGQALDEANQAIFYSTWQYSAVQLLTGIKDFQTLEAISKRLDLSSQTSREIVDFLLSTGLCVRRGRLIDVGQRRTHLVDHSPLRPRHHMNWRLKAIEEMPSQRGHSVFFTSPMRIDERTFQELSTKLKALIQEVHQSVDSAGDETLACLNLDWFRF